MALDLRRERSPAGTTPPGPGPATVTTVVVARRATHLAAVVHGLHDQVRRPDRVVGIDLGEGSAQDPRIAEVLAAGSVDVLSLAATATTGDAVTAALAVADADALAPTPDPRGPAAAAPPAAAREWVWVLDDRSVPHPRALAELLGAVERAPRVAVAGCKQRAGSAGQELVEVGSTMSRWGRRITGVEAGEPDQGQLDHREDVLAVSPVGMLVARDVWDALHGTDPALPDAGADLDLGRRARLAGHRVVVVPGAVLTRPAGPSAPGHDAPGHPAASARRSAAYLRLAGARWWALPVVALSVLLGGLARSVLGALAKEPARGTAALAGAVGALSRPRHLLRSRRRAARARTLPRRQLRPLHAGVAEVGRWHRARWAPRPAGAGQHAAATLLDTPVPPGSRSRTGRSAAWTAAALGAVLAVASLAALWPVAGTGPVTAAALAPAPDSAGELWDAARTGWVPAGAGHAGPADLLLEVLAALAGAAGLVGGSPSAAVAALLLVAVPGSGLAAWWATGALTRSTLRRLLAASCWAAAPSLLLAVDSGRLGPVLAHLALPVVARCAAEAALSPHRRTGWSWAGCAALALVPVTAGAPLLLLPAVVLTAVAAAAGRRPRVLAALLPSLALAGPALAATGSSGTGFGAVRLAATGGTAAGEPAASWQLALGWPQAPHTWPLTLPAVPDAGPLPLLAAAAVPALLVLAALPAALRTGRAPAAVRWGLAASVTGLLTAVVASRVVLPDAGTAARAWPGAATSLAVLGLLVAGVAGLPAWRARRRPVAIGAGLAVALLAAVPLVGVLAWSAAHTVDGGVQGPRRGADLALPAAVVDTATSADQARVLALRARPDGSLGVSLLRGDGPALEAAGRVGRPKEPDAADEALDRATVDLVSGVGDPRVALAPFGVGAVVVLPGDGDTAALAAALDATAALTPSGRVDGLRAWRVEAASGTSSTSPDRPAALRLVAPDGVATALPSSPFGARADIASGPAGRTLALAERSDAGWRALLDGRELRPRTVDGWAQGWELPGDGGRLELRYESAASSWWGPAQAGLLVLAALVAVPVRRTRRAVPVPEPERTA